jgi:hypothetical protein
VDSTQHPSFNHAFSDFIKCSKGFYYARRGCAFQFYDDSRACSEHVFQYLFRRSGISCVPGDVVGKWRRDEKWRSTGIRTRIGIAVTVRRADGRHEAPLVVGELGIPRRNKRRKRTIYRLVETQPGVLAIGSQSEGGWACS